MTCVDMKGPPCEEMYSEFGIQLGYEEAHDSSSISAIGVVLCAPLHSIHLPQLPIVHHLHCNFVVEAY
jgi:hypothetical protein